MKAFTLSVSSDRGGGRFALFHEAVGQQRGAIVQVPAFAEEMNLSRRMAALQARALAEAGFSVLQFDLYGCGDSEGNLENAGWATWVNDTVAAAGWLHKETSLQPIFWGVRSGALLAADAARSGTAPTDFVFWQPVLSGEHHWRQFLRIREVADRLANQEPSRSAVVESLATDKIIEVAGYPVPDAVVQGLSTSRLAAPFPLRHVLCFELTPGGASTPALIAQAERWRVEGAEVELNALAGPAFWQSPEADDTSALIDATTHRLCVTFSRAGLG